MLLHMALFYGCVVFSCIYEPHVGCFHVLVIMNSVAMNTGVHVYFLTIGFVWIYDQEWDR